jgi:hypothetical protein
MRGYEEYRRICLERENLHGLAPPAPRLALDPAPEPEPVAVEPDADGYLSMGENARRAREMVGRIERSIEERGGALAALRAGRPDAERLARVRELTAKAGLDG